MEREKPGGKEYIEGKVLMEEVDIVLFDLDAVIANTAIPAIERIKNILKEELGPDVNLDFHPSDIERFGQATVWAKERGLTGERLENIEKEVWGDVSIYEEAELIEDSVETVLGIRSAEKKVEFHTSRPKGSRLYTLDWLSENVPSVSEQELTTVDDMDSTRNEIKADNAVRKAKEHGTVLVIDDSPRHVRLILQRAQEENVDVWAILVPYGKVIVDEDLLENDRLIVIERENENQGIGKVLDYLI
jgi:hypothetical protein